MTSLFLPFPKTTVLIPSGPSNDQDRMHLFIILTNPSTEKKLNIIVSLATYTGWPNDSTCILNQGEHPFIRHKSYVLYSKAKTFESKKLIRGVQDGKLVPKDPIDQNVFEKIVDGLMASERTPKKIKNFFAEHG